MVTHIEYSGMKFGLFFVGEYIGIVTISALMVTLFFGGWQGPLLPPFIWFALKTAFFYDDVYFDSCVVTASAL